MKKTPNTALSIRVQASGGKFLGDDIGGASITVRNGQTGEILTSGTTKGGSGKVVDRHSGETTRQTIITPGIKPQIWWLQADPGSSTFVAEFYLSAPTLLEISAFGPLAGLQTAHRVTVTQWAYPGQELNQLPDLVIEMPGLLTQVLNPPTHAKYTKGSKVPLAANVTMMCGCPIKATGYWISSDFEVTARIGIVGSGKTKDVELHFDGTTSLFTGEYLAEETGFYQTSISAAQASTGNIGAGVVTFLCID